MSTKTPKKQQSAPNSRRNRHGGKAKVTSSPRRGPHDRDMAAMGRTDTTPPRAGKAPPKPPQNGYFIWGRHAIDAALANPERRIASLYASPESSAWLAAQITALPAARRADLPTVQPIDRPRLDAIGGPDDKAVHQGVAAAVWPLDPPHLDGFLAGLGAGRVRLVLLDHLSDPRNVGAIMRSARAFGVQAVITTYRNAAEETGTLARAASGALDHLPLIRVVNLARAIEQLQAHDIVVAGLAGDGSQPVGALGAHDRLGIVLGAEGSGLRRLSRDNCDMLVAIDIDPDADSLNVSNAAAIAFYAAGPVKPDAR